MSGASVWSEAEITALRRMWAEGLSASQIARILGTGRSRNAVIGRVHRMKLAQRAMPSRDLNRNPCRRRVRPRLTPEQREAFGKRVGKAPEVQLPAQLAEIRALQPIDPTLGVLKLNNFTCRYPIGDPDDPAFAFCGRTCDEDRAFCASHHRLCYHPAKPLQPRQRSIRPTWREGWEVAA